MIVICIWNCSFKTANACLSYHIDIITILLLHVSPSTTSIYFLERHFSHVDCRESNSQLPVYKILNTKIAWWQSNLFIFYIFTTHSIFYILICIYALQISLVKYNGQQATSEQKKTTNKQTILAAHCNYGIIFVIAIAFLCLLQLRKSDEQPDYCLFYFCAVVSTGDSFDNDTTGCVRCAIWYTWSTWSITRSLALSLSLSSKWRSSSYAIHGILVTQRNSRSVAKSLFSLNPHYNRTK